MTHHPTEDRLHRLVDGELAGAGAREIEAHLAACAECRAVVAQLERLRRSVAQLPRELAPPAAIEAALRERIAGAAARAPYQADVLVPARPPARVARWAIAAAVVIAIGGFVMAQRYRPVDEPAAPFNAARPAAGQPVAFDVSDSAGGDGDARVLELLRDELERRRPLLSPRTVRAVEENLRTIDLAIAAIRRALASDPGNPQLATMLAQTQRQRSEYLRTALDLTSGL